jgi:hypothetical protein
MVVVAVIMIWKYIIINSRYKVKRRLNAAEPNSPKRSDIETVASLNLSTRRTVWCRPISCAVRLGVRLGRIDFELIKDDAILDDGAQRAEKPRDGFDKIAGLQRVAEDTQTVCQVARERQQEEEQSQALAGLLAVVLDNLRDASTS